MKYEDLLGCPFKVHGRNKKEGFDCLGLAIEVLKREGIELPDLWYDNINADTKNEVNLFVKENTRFKKIEKPILNSIIEIEVRGLPTHIAVYIGNGMIIHSMIGIGVVIEPIQRYAKRITGVYKLCNN